MMYFQKDPTSTLIIVFLVIGVYVYYKSRKSKGRSRRGFGFLGGGMVQEQQDTMSSIAMLIMLQQFSQPHPTKTLEGKKKDPYKKEVEKNRKKTLKLFEDW